MKQKYLLLFVITLVFAWAITRLSPHSHEVDTHNHEQRAEAPSQTSASSELTVIENPIQTPQTAEKDVTENEEPGGPVVINVPSDDERTLKKNVLKELKKNIYWRRATSFVKERPTLEALDISGDKNIRLYRKAANIFYQEMARLQETYVPKGRFPMVAEGSKEHGLKVTYHKEATFLSFNFGEALKQLSPDPSKVDLFVADLIAKIKYPVNN